MGLIGAILGDIAGSQYEYSKPVGFNYKTVELFDEKSFFTDDTVLSIATKVAVDNEISFTECYQKFGKLYPNAGYGDSFKNWIDAIEPKPYNSFGNGSAMRVSYIGEKYDYVLETMAKKSAICTHNHPEGVKGAVVISRCIEMARTGSPKREILSYVKNYYEEGYIYPVTKSLEEIRSVCKYDVTCQGSVPVAIICFLESKNYESCIRNVLSLRCDTDTVACIAGGIAESFYGTTGFDNDYLLTKYLDDTLYNIVMS